jgi:hypothetical protein
MNAAAPPFQSQAKLWLMAFVLSAALNAVILVVIGLWLVAAMIIQPPSRAEPALETIALIVPSMEPAPPDGAAEAGVLDRPDAPSFARTSPDQAEEAPESPDFIGERNTRATSDATPRPDGPDLPSQQGREPRWEDEIETTESNYQDGELANDRSAEPAAPPMAAEAAAAEPAEPEIAPVPADPTSASVEAPIEKERIAEGPVPVDRMVKDSPETEEAPKPTPAERAEEGKEKQEETAKPAEAAKPASDPDSPGFRGNQSKTRLEGSISRTGRSALNVEDSVLGRYHASVSRAVEKEWQRNCVRNRDYITPGQLTMRVMLEPTGKVRSVGFVEEFGVGNIPKGFTLNSIRDAEIPAMPAELKKQLDGEPLELIYRFNF